MNSEVSFKSMQKRKSMYSVTIFYAFLEYLLSNQKVYECIF